MNILLKNELEVCILSSFMIRWLDLAISRMACHMKMVMIFALPPIVKSSLHILKAFV